MAAVFIVLSAHNLVLLARNQLIFDRRHRTRVHDSRLAELAAESSHVRTRTMTAAYYLLRDRIQGVVVVPRSVAGAVWWIERVSRLEVEIARPPPQLPADRFAALIAGAEPARPLRVRGVDHRLHLRVGDEARHVMASTAEDPLTLLLLPESLYRQASAR